MDFQLLKQVVKNIITAIEQSAVVSVRALKAHTFSVKVDFPKVQQVAGSLSTESAKTDGLLQRLLVAIGRLPTQYPKTVIPPYPKFPAKIEISNPVSRVTVTNTGEIEKKLDVLATKISKLPTSYPEFPAIPKVEIPACPKIPEYPKFPDSIKVSNPVKTVEVSNFPETEGLISDKPEYYVPVRLTDGKEFYRAVENFSIAARSRERVTVSNSDPTAEYQISDRVVGATKYYGFLKADGSWYIMRDTGTTYRYVRGDSGYPSAWTNRSSQTYDLFSEVF
jgi:hypothetical protein